ncbi:MAG: NRDE family protein, partial [Proteobacteria bacterium]|nr:NRDE family protein [Pseudomonadota bacterium]
MCLILFSLQQNDAYPLVVIANRDEYYARPTQTAHWWPDTPGIFAGRDLTARGTWMGVNKNGRFAAVTNVREPGSFGPARLSRGKLTRDFLSSREPAETFLKSIESSADDYAGFNLLVGDSSGLYFYSNRHPAIRCIPPGIYGISNGMFDEHWPKLENGKQALAKIAASPPDLVVTDLMMPEMNGLELVRTIRRRHADIPVILMTAYGDESTAIEALEAGA